MGGAAPQRCLHLQGAAQLHCVTLVHHGDAEVGSLKQLFEDEAVGLVSGACGGKQATEKEKTQTVTERARKKNKNGETGRRPLKSERSLTDGRFAELLVRHLAGDVGPHEDADLDLQLLSNDVGDELESVGPLVDALDDNNRQE